MAYASRPYDKTVAVLATMHGKEQVIAPVLDHGLALRIALAIGLNTDQFGTFSRDVERKGSRLDAARAKIEAAFDYAPYARVGIASEGSFGPHPDIPFLPVGHELVLLVDRESGVELAGHDVSMDTNFGHAIVSNVVGALEFAKRSGFPSHGLIVTGTATNRPAPDTALIKDITDSDSLRAAIHEVVGECGAAFVESDMRAHRNPTRMKAIGRAATDLARRFQNRCPACSFPGFDVIERVRGLPCEWCGAPTHQVKSEILGCRTCGHHEKKAVTPCETASPSHCPACNP